ncbi:helix-turn-helix domain-containing protein [Telmatospirillum sp. J64-1]|uniref:MerR family transcriptional regulator n=1 Tax=Telmatospirillum sp. J64-1 TaxID=2502183 RepID=UPI00115E72B4|nr:helix-turn-helix domain-containing protein [Telmatospirillum sp. J64-1]
MAKSFTIGRLAKESGCKVPTIRYYEQVGLMPLPDRSEGNQRLYERRHLERLRFIRHSRELGFTLDDIRDLLLLSEHPEQPCETADDIARRHLESVRDRIRRLQLLEGELARMVGQCGQHKVANCRVIEILSDHGKCQSGDHPPIA